RRRVEETSDEFPIFGDWSAIRRPATVVEPLIEVVSPVRGTRTDPEGQGIDNRQDLGERPVTSRVRRLVRGTRRRIVRRLRSGSSRKKQRQGHEQNGQSDRKIQRPGSSLFGKRSTHRTTPQNRREQHRRPGDLSRPN